MLGSYKDLCHNFGIMRWFCREQLCGLTKWGYAVVVERVRRKKDSAFCHFHVFQEKERQCILSLTFFRKEKDYFVTFTFL